MQPRFYPPRQDHNELGTRPRLICKLVACHVCLCRCSAWGCQQETRNQSGCAQSAAALHIYRSLIQAFSGTIGALQVQSPTPGQ